MALAAFTEITRDNLRYWQTRLAAASHPERPALEAHAQGLQRALAFGLQQESNREEALSLALQLAPLIDARGDWLDWTDLFEEARRTALAQGHPLATALHNRLGSLYKSCYRHDDARRAHQAALELSRWSGDLQEEVNALLGLSELEHLRHRYEQAESLARRALRRCREGNLEDTRLAAAHNLLGMIAHNRGDYEEAEKRYRRAIDIWRRLDAGRHCAYALSNLALTLQSQRRLDEALEAIETARPLFEASGAWLSVVNSQLSLGTIHFLRREYSQALLAFSAIDWLKLERLGYEEPLGWTTNNLGNAHLKLGNYTEAAEYLEYSAALWRSLGDGVALGNTIGALAEAYAGAGQPQAALQRFEEAIALLAEHPENAWAGDRKARLQAQKEALERKARA